MNQHSFFLFHSSFILILIIVSVLFVSSNFNCFSQTNTAPAKSDTSAIKHSPRTATWMSALVPGLGQIYNRKYWKAPIIWGGMTICGYQALHFQKLYHEYRNAYAALLAPEPDTSLTWALQNKYAVLKLEYGQIPEQVTFYKTQYQSNMNMSYILLFGIYFLNIVDAMVDAHFYDFDINDNLSLHLNPEIKPMFYQLNSLGLRCILTF